MGQVKAQRASVLIVEDDPALLRMNTIFLRMAGYEVREASDGITALEVIEAGGIDVLVLDMMLPVLDGWGVLRRLQHSGFAATLPIVVVTASAETALEDRARSLGVVRYLVKPLDIRMLLDVVADVLKEKTLERAP